MPKVHIEVKKGTNENNMTLLRRFTRKVQDTRMIQKVKGERYNERAKSKLTTKKGALKRLARWKENDKPRKLGKVIERKKGGRR